jgi:hypothetical protein
VDLLLTLLCIPPIIVLMVETEDRTPYTRLKLKLGVHEFEAEGPPDLVMSQLQAFKELIAAMPPTPAAVISPPGASLALTGSTPAVLIEQGSPDTPPETLGRIMKVEDRVVSLTARARSTDDAVLLLLYGQKVIRANDSVTGAEVISGLTATGIKIDRVDRLLEKAGEIGDVIVVGSGRGKRYRLTNSGFAKTRAIANELLATVA